MTTPVWKEYLEYPGGYGNLYVCSNNYVVDLL